MAFARPARTRRISDRHGTEVNKTNRKGYAAVFDRPWPLIYCDGNYLALACAIGARPASRGYSDRAAKFCVFLPPGNEFAYLSRADADFVAYRLVVAQITDRCGRES